MGCLSLEVHKQQEYSTAQSKDSEAPKEQRRPKMGSDALALTLQKSSHVPSSPLPSVGFCPPEPDILQRADGWHHSRRKKLDRGGSGAPAETPRREWNVVEFSRLVPLVDDAACAFLGSGVTAHVPPPPPRRPRHPYQSLSCLFLLFLKAGCPYGNGGVTCPKQSRGVLPRMRGIAGIAYQAQCHRAKRPKGSSAEAALLAKDERQRNKQRRGAGGAQHVKLKEAAPWVSRSPELIADGVVVPGFCKRRGLTVMAGTWRRTLSLLGGCKAAESPQEGLESKGR